MKTILVVDDEPDIVSVLQMVLEGHGFRVATAMSGTGGLDALAQLDGTPDLVLADMMMPGMNGAEMVLRMRQSGHRDLRAVLVTAVPRAATRDQAKLFTEIVQKPVRSTQLLQLVERLIGPP